MMEQQGWSHPAPAVIIRGRMSQDSTGNQSPTISPSTDAAFARQVQFVHIAEMDPGEGRTSFTTTLLSVILQPTMSPSAA